MKRKLGAIQINDSRRKFRIKKGQFLIFSFWTKWIPFNDMLHYEVRKQTEDVSKKRLAVLGTNGTAATVTTYADIHVDIDNIRAPYVDIPIMRKRLKGRKYEKAQRRLNDAISGLQFIERNQTKNFTGNASKGETL